MKILFLQLVASLSCLRAGAQVLITEKSNQNRNDYKISGVANYNPVLSKSLLYPYSAYFAEQLLKTASYFHKINKNEASLYWMKEALRYCPEGSNLQAEIYERLLSFYLNNGQLEEALRYYHLALPLLEDNRSRAKFYLRINELFQVMGDYERSLQGLEEAYQIFAQEGDYLSMAMCLGRKAGVYREREQYRSYLTALKETLATLDRIEQPAGYSKIALDYRNRTISDIGDAYLQLKMPDSALVYLTQEGLIDNLIDSVAKGVTLTNIGLAYILKGETHKAEQYIIEAKNLIEQGGYRVMLMQMAQELAVAYSNAGNYKAAWQQQQRYLALKDSITSIATIHRINALEAKYNLTLKDRELDRKAMLLLRQDARLQARSWWIICLALALVSVAFNLLVSRRSYRHKQKLAEEKINSLAREQKMKQIEARSKGEEKERVRIAKELHDGVLSEVLALKLNLAAMKQEYAHWQLSAPYQYAVQQSEEIALKLRQTAHNLMPVHLQEKGLLASVETFIRRINARNINFTLQHLGELPPLNAEVEKIVFLMLLELVQNIIKHAKATEAIIQMNYYNQQLSITIEDNGVGMNKEQQYTTEGIGLMNLRETIALLEGTFDIQSSEYTGTTILVEIPIAATSSNASGLDTVADHV